MRDRLSQEMRALLPAIVIVQLHHFGDLRQVLLQHGYYLVAQGLRRGGVNDADDLCSFAFAGDDHHDALHRCFWVWCYAKPVATSDGAKDSEWRQYGPAYAG